MSYKKNVKVSKFPFNKFDIKRLQNQVSGLYNGFTVAVSGEGVDIISPNLLREDQDIALDALIAVHDGEPQKLLIKDTSNANRALLQTIIVTALDRADLAPAVPAIRAYFRYLSACGHVDDFVYFGGVNTFIQKIESDANRMLQFASLPPEDQIISTILTAEEIQVFPILLAEVTAPSTNFPNGVKAWEFLVNSIL